MPKVTPASRIERALRRIALAYPGAWEDHPWGENVVKVKEKVFVFFGVPDGRLHVTVKLPQSGLLALSLPFAQPTGYGLGRSGWVTARFAPREKPPVELLERWIDESYRAVAPKALLARLASEGAAQPRRASSGGRRPRKRR